MAKPTFAKLGLTKNTEVKIFVYNEQEIEVKQYLPIEEKLELIANAINNVLATDENKFPNYIKLEMYLKLEIVFKYTNLSFTEKQKEDLPKLYDLLAGNHIFDLIDEVLPSKEVLNLQIQANKLFKGIHEYNNSAYGILDNVSKNYSDMELDINKLRNDLATADGLDIIKNVVDKLG